MAIVTPKGNGPKTVFEIKLPSFMNHKGDQKQQTKRPKRDAGQKIETSRHRQPLKKRDFETHENRLKFCETRTFFKDHLPPLHEYNIFLILKD